MESLFEWFIRTYPELVQSMKNCKHAYINEDGTERPNPFHLEDSIFTHTCMVYQNAIRFKGKYSGALELCALLHDVGKVTARVQEDNKTRFKCHEALSAYQTVDIVKAALNKGYVAKAYVSKILAVIALHGKLYEIKPEEVKKYFDKDDWILVQMLIDFCSCDATGRFAAVGQDKYFDKEAYQKGWSEVALSPELKDYDSLETKKKLTVLIGPPCSGKSTWIDENIKSSKVISRDDLLECMYKDRGTYSEIFKSLTDDEQKKIDEQLMKDYTKALRDGDSVVIDMTNMSKKSRAKFLNGHKGLKDYTKQAVVFFVSEYEFSRRNEMRSHSGKSMPHRLYTDMVKRFVYPLKDEFDSVKVVL